MKTLCLFIFTISLISCEAPQTKNTLLGTWKMHKVLQHNTDVSNTHNPFMERTIRFKPDSTYYTQGRPYEPNTGRYAFNHNHLFLDSDIGPEDDSYWQVSIKGDTMKWVGTKTEWAKAFTLVYIAK